MKKYFKYILGFIGITTLILTLSLLLNAFLIRTYAGNYVLPVVWGNFMSSLIYLYTTYKVSHKHHRTGLLLVFASIILIMAYIGLQIHISEGKPFEPRIFRILFFRIYLTLFLAALAYKYYGNQAKDILC